MNSITQILIAFVIGHVSMPAVAAPPSALELKFATYLGGNSFDAARDVCVDHAGNIIVVGGTSSTDFPTTPGVYSRTLQTGGASLGKLGVCDAFVAKYTPAGQLIWATYLGGPNYDRAYAVEVDGQDRIFVAGRAGEGFPTTAGSFQPGYKDTFPTNKSPGADEYGKQNGFVACLSSAGQLTWASYVWYGSLTRDLAVDDLGDVYLTSGWNGNFAAPPAFTVGFKKTPTMPGGANAYQTVGDTCVIKVKGDGTQILWGNWLCGSGDEAMQCMVRVDSSRNAYFVCTTKSSNMPVNPADQGDHTHNGGGYDYYLAKISADGTNLVYGTYLGGSGNENIDTHQLAVDPEGNAYVALLTPSTNLPTTSGAFQTQPGGQDDLAICKVGPTGALLLCTYLGGSGNEAVEGLSVDTSGNVYVTGATRSPNFPVAGTPYQGTYGPPAVFNSISTADVNGFLTIVAADFHHLAYSTFVGQQASIVGNTLALNAIGGFHASVLAPDGSLIAVGSWSNDGFPKVNACQPTFFGGPTPPLSVSPLYTKHCDACIARFAPPAGTLVFSSATYSLAEGNTGSFSGMITVKRTGGTFGAVSTAYATADGTGTAGSDYLAASGTLNWADGDATDKTFFVSVTGDASVEADETVALTLTNPLGGASLGSLASATLTILDDDVSYDRWAASYGLSGQNAVATAQLTGDRISNLMKYALGLNPTLVCTMVTDGISPGLPSVEVASGNLTLLYQKDAIKGDITYVPEYSDDLVTWSSTGVTETLLAAGGNIQTIRASVPTAGSSRKFIRLRVTR